MAKMRLTYYAVASFAAAGGVVIKAFNDRPNFYSAAVYLSQTPLCYMILANFALLCFGSVVYGLQRLLFGELRIIERERLWERGWISITETLLIMMTFRDDVGGWFLFILSNLVVARIWAWIAEGRIEMLEQQPPSNPRIFHARLSASLIVSCIFNSFFLRYCVDVVLEEAKPGMMVMFAFEFVVLTISSFSNLFRYAIALYEIRIVQRQTKARVEARRAEIRTQRREAEERARANTEESADAADPLADLPNEDDVDENEIDVPGWEDKGRWVFALDILTDFLRLVVYLAFFSVLMIFHGIPVHIVRDVYVTLQSFLKRIWSFYQYSSATKDMNTRYPDATAEELERENTCIVCREEMRPWPQDGQPEMEQRLRAKKLPCGHVLHFGCLRSWLERQQVCPTCRRPVLDSSAGNAATENHHPAGGPAQAAPNAQGHPPAPAAALGQQPGQAPGPAQPRAVPQGQNPLAQWRPRVFNLGPLRLAFGTMPANALNMLQRGQVNAGNAGGAPAIAQPAPLVDEANLEPSAYNVRDQRSTEQQLLQMEWEISRQVTELNLSAHHLSLVRALQTELTRLRSTHAAVQQYYQAMAPDSAATDTVAAGSSTSSQVELPPGLVLPEGWTLLPLTRTEDPSLEPSSNAAAQMTSTQPFSPHSSSVPPQPTPTIPLAGSASSHQHEPLQNGSGSQETERVAGSSTGAATQTLHPVGGSTTVLPDNSILQQPSGGAAVSASDTPQNQNTPAPTWNFDNVSSGSSSHHPERDSNSNGSVPAPTTANGTANGSLGKGKGRAVTVEDEQE